MEKQYVSFKTVFDKYIIYSEAVHQFNKLPEEDKAIIQPYIQFLKQQWQDELQAVKTKTKDFSTANSLGIKYLR